MPQKEQIHKPSRILYSAIFMLIRFFLALLFRCKINRDPSVDKIEGGFLLLSNHVSYVDPLLVAAAIGIRRPINFLAGSFLFSKPSINCFFHALGVIPKVQFTASAGALRQMLRILRDDGVVAVFPEGQRSMDGGPCRLDPSIGKLAKHIKLPVVCVTLKGAYLTWPRWSKVKIPKGHIEIDVKMIMDGSSAVHMTETEIQSLIGDSLKTEDYAWNHERQRPYIYRKGKTAQGLENLLYICPRCLSHACLETNADTISCKNCQASYRISPHGNFSMPIVTGEEKRSVLLHPLDWHQWQKLRMEAGSAQNSFSETYIGRINLIEKEALLQGEAYQDLGEGELKIHAHIVELVCASCDFGLTIDLKKQAGIMMELGDYIQFQDATSIIRFYTKQVFLPSYISDLHSIYCGGAAAEKSL